jgi:hypothetical protein
MEVSDQTSHPGRFTPRERDPDTHWIGDWGGGGNFFLLGGVLWGYFEVIAGRRASREKPVLKNK